VLGSEANERERIDFACALAERFSAHLIGLFRLPTPEALRHFGYYPTLLDPFFVELLEGRGARPSKCAKPSTCDRHSRAVRAVARDPGGSRRRSGAACPYAELAILGQLDPKRRKRI
jgi:hypothetical protein